MNVPYPSPPPAPAEEMRRLQRVAGSREVAFQTRQDATVELAQRLFQGPSRWGWEYVEPAALTPYPYLDSYPVWHDPPPPDLRREHYALRSAKASMGKLLATAAVLLVLGLFLTAPATEALGVLLIVAGLGVGAFGVGRVVMAQSAISRAQAEAAQDAAARRRLFEEKCRKWDDAIEQHDRAEWFRAENEPLLYPLAPGGHTSRVDVFGGTPTGWAALLATIGSGMLSEQGSVLLVDLTGHDVARPLRALTEAVGAPTATATVPAACDAPWLLGELSARDLADVLADAIDAMRGRTDTSDQRSMDVEIIETVARQLERPWTFDRLAAGVQVLRSTYDFDADDRVLSDDEVTKLSRRVALLDPGDRMRDEMRHVWRRLGALGESERAAGDAGDATALWPAAGGLTVLCSTEANNDRRKFVDQVLIQTLVHRLATAGPGARNPVLVVTGADELGRSALEALASRAYQRQVRLVYLFHHLRDDAAALLGGGDSAAVLMRLGHADEAEAAAKYIGRRYSFKLSQLSRQVGTTSGESINHGTTVTHGGSRTVGSNGSVTNSHGGSTSRSIGGGHSGGLFGQSSSNWSRQDGTSWGESVTEGWSESLTDTWSTSEQHGRSFSTGRSENDGSTLQRSYEFDVEPTQIQELEHTTFLLVDRGPHGRRVRMGDCFPGAVFVPRISPTPRPDATALG